MTDPIGDDNSSDRGSGWPVKALTTGLCLFALVTLIVSGAVATPPQARTNPAGSTSAVAMAPSSTTEAATSAPGELPPAGLVRGTLPLPGEGLIHLTARVCGSSKTWQAQAAVNGVKAPNYTIYLGQPLSIDCSRLASEGWAPASKTQPAAPVPAAGWVAPLTGRCDSTDEFGAPRYNPQTGQHYSHQGRDLPARTGTPIHAITAGRIISARDIGRGGLQVQLQSGNVIAKFNHLSGFAVHAGQSVSAGTVIGYVGATGDATGPHLHLEIWVSGALRNPTTFLASHGIRLGC